MFNKKKGEKMNIYSIMGYSLNFPKSFQYDKNNLPYVKLDADLNNGKTISYLKPLQSRLTGFNDDINFLSSSRSFFVFTVPFISALCL